ncbi:MAG: rRNA (guanine966-N2)-methyltransferase [Acidimicrobiaceae bacterium]|nr:rRNA (guanine966-N2)-methyltransferase [Acidimicrobiaceae bacterium]
MRVVAGTARGRRLQAPGGDAIRPTSDRVREAIFNSLHSMDAVVDATVADLFAGTGAMGIEALSRGAAEVTFVDHDRIAIATVRANLTSTGLASPAAKVVPADVLRWVSTAPPVDVALLDPPYQFTGWRAVLDHLSAGLIVCESGADIDLGERWEVVRSKRYGSTVVTVAHAQEGDRER